MEILQYYYTSFINKETGSAGFQVKAMSQGIRPETQTMIARSMAYRIPPALNEREIRTHPIALRYSLLNTQECLLMCSQSNGNDPNGRPGNFFAHVLVTDPALFKIIPPIFYWKSAFWLKEDTQTQTTLATLADLPGDPGLDIDEMWNFLQQDGCSNLLFKLMCAVIDGVSNRRRIIIIDTDEHVALWVAAISCMLPPAYRPLLSFTTYHHDPYQSQFFITGTPLSAQFRLNHSDYESYFVLNIPENKTSDVKNSDSLYARLICQFATAETYDTEMLDFFSKYAHRFPNPTTIDNQLDLIVSYANIMREDESILLSEMKQRALLLVLPTFEHLKNYTIEDIHELQHLEKFIWKSYKAYKDININEMHQRILKLEKDHEVPTEDILKKQIAHYTEELFIDDVRDTWKYANENLEQLHREYGNDIFINQMNLPTYLKSLTNQAMRAQAHHLIRVWKYIGPYLLPESPCLPLFVRSIQVWSVTFKESTQALKTGNDLFTALQTAIQTKDLAWVTLLVNGLVQQSVKIEPEYLELFYCTLIFRLSLQQREPYRNVVKRLQANIVEAEFLSDLKVANLQNMLPILLQWITYARDTQLYDLTRLVAQGLPKLRKRCNEKQWRDMAQYCLSDIELFPLLGGEETLLVKEVFADITLGQFASDYVPLYQRYHDDPALPAQCRIVMSAMLAMQQRHLDAQLVGDLYNYVSQLPLEQYDIAIRSFCTAFFTGQLSDEEHFQLLSALFVWRYEKYFWLIYWEKIVIQPAQVLNHLMLFWFSAQPLKLHHPYVTQHFFLTLQYNFQMSQISPDFQKALEPFQEQPWYIAIEESNLIRKNALLTMGQGLVKQVQKRLPNQKAGEEAQEEQRQLNRDMKGFFEPEKIRETHLGMLPSIYHKQQPEQFWEAYKEHLIQALLSNKVSLIIELFTFWFDNSFESLGQEPYIAQSFFIGLPQIFDLARKENETNFRKMSQQIHTYITQSNAGSWYFLLHKYLSDANAGEQKPRWFRK